jgi:hypothetical protein
MDDDDQREVRASIGTHAMASMDLLTDDAVLERIQDAVDTMTDTMQALVNAGWTIDAATGFLIGVFLAARNHIADGEGGT